MGIFANPLTHLAEGINESLLEGVGEVLHANGYDVFLELSAIRGQSRALPNWSFDGAILLQLPTSETIVELHRRRIPYVCVNERIGDPVAFVVSDDAMGMTQAIDHLHGLGHRALLTPTRGRVISVTTAWRSVTPHLYRRCGELDLQSVSGHDVPFGLASDFLQHAIIEQHATAVVSYDHQIAVALVGAGGKMGLRIPDQFSLVCFNDVFPVSVMAPPLTAVSVSGVEMGRVGSDVLIKNLQVTHREVGEVIKVPENLIVRASTAPPGG